jgi:hypothetical protein
MNSGWNHSDPPSLVLYKQAKVYYDLALGFGMVSQPAPLPTDTELVLWRKITNYTATMAGRIPL